MPNKTKKPFLCRKNHNRPEVPSKAAKQSTKAAEFSAVSKEVENEVVFRWEEDGSLSKTPFSTSLTVLTVGDGDFSFSYSLALMGINVIATVYNSQQSFLEEFDDSFYRELCALNAPIFFGVDVTKPKWVDTINEAWDILVWNFPHNGKGICSQTHNIYSQQQLLSKFFTNLPRHSSHDGSNLFNPIVKRKKPDKSALFDIVHNNTLSFDRCKLVYITIWSGEPYDSWDVRQIARRCGFVCICSFKFKRDAYAHYQHTKTKRGIKSGFEKPAKTFVFATKFGS